MRRIVLSRRSLMQVLSLGALSVLASSGWSDTPPPAVDTDSAPVPTPATTPPPSHPNWFSPSFWYNPATAPFLPVPEVATDPDSGTTVGLLAVKLKTDENGDIRQIIAPDFLYNPYFGYGGHARIYD